MRTTAPPATAIPGAGAAARPAEVDPWAPPGRVVDPPAPAHPAPADPWASPRPAMPAGPGAQAPRPQRPVRGPSFAAELVTRFLALLAVGALGFVAFLMMITPVQQNSAQDVLYSQLRGPLAEAIPPYAGDAESGSGETAITREVPAVYDDGEDVLIPAGAPIALLEVPRLGLTQVVVEGTSSADLQAGPGHRRDTVLPGQAGVSLIYGRASTFGGPFRGIPDLLPGDRLRVVTFQGQFSYVVEGVRRDGDPLPDVAPIVGGKSRLTLVTAQGDNVLQPGKTVFVDALLEGDAQPAAQRPSLIPPDERALRSDMSALLPLVLWMQGLAVLAVVLTWARTRWGRWESHMVGFPAVLAVVWQLFEGFARLLPNLT